MAFQCSNRNGAGVRILLKPGRVLWTDSTYRPTGCDWHAVYLKRQSREAQRDIARQIRALPKKWNRWKGRMTDVFNRADVTAISY